MSFLAFPDGLEAIVPIIRTIIVIVVVFIIFNFILHAIKKRLLKLAKTKKQISNIEIFSKTSKYLILLILIIFALFLYAGSWTGLGLAIGLLTAAIGWALQKPISGIAAWLMVITRRPFDIGDRIVIGNVKGDVSDISITHIYLREVSGTFPSEENSGRIIMVPNALLFEQNIINYTLYDDYVLDQVIVPVTYESNLDKAVEVALNAAKLHTKGFAEATKKGPYIRTFFQPNGINVHVRYFVPAKKLEEFSSRITKEIFDKITQTKDVEIAYPHTEVILRKKE